MPDRAASCLTSGEISELAASYRGPNNAFEVEPVEFTRRFDGGLRTMPLRFDVPLSALEPGSYDCQLAVLDPAGGKAAFWRQPVALVE